MGLIKEGIDKIKCGIGWHSYYAVPVEYFLSDYVSQGRPHMIDYEHECKKCGYRRHSTHDMRDHFTVEDEFRERIKK